RASQNRRNAPESLASPEWRFSLGVRALPAGPQDTFANHTSICLQCCRPRCILRSSAEECRERTQTHSNCDDAAQSCDCGRTLMFSPITQQVSVPEDLAVPYGKAIHAVTSTV